MGTSAGGSVAKGAAVVGEPSPRLPPPLLGHAVSGRTTLDNAALVHIGWPALAADGSLARRPLTPDPWCRQAAENTLSITTTRPPEVP